MKPFGWCFTGTGKHRIVSCHTRFAKLALELGKPVLCEKSFTVTAEETDERIALAKEKRLYLAEAIRVQIGLEYPDLE